MWDHDYGGVILGLAFWGFLAAIIIVPRVLKYREQARMQDTLRVAYEKGQPVPPELIEAMRSREPMRIESTPERDLRRAIVLIAVGLGLAGLGYGLWYGLSSVSDEGAYITGGAVAGSGAIPGFIGIAYLILWFDAPPGAEGLGEPRPRLGEGEPLMAGSAPPLASAHDLDLVAMVGGGGRAAFSELVRRHGSAVRALLRRMGADAAMADDLAQDAFLTAFERIAEFRGEGTFAAWLKRIAARLYLKRWRGAARDRALAQAAAEEADTEVWSPPARRWRPNGSISIRRSAP